MYKLPYIELEQGASGYVRGDYEFDDDKFNEDINREISKLGLKKEEDIIAFVKEYANENAYIYRGEFREIRDDKTNGELDFRISPTKFL